MGRKDQQLMSFKEAVRRTVITWSLNILYLIVYFITFGKHTIHEGKYFKSSNTYVNWSIDYKCQPARYATPSSEDEIRHVIRTASRLRAVGAGHSFNHGTLTEGVILSLDNYNKIIEIDGANLQVTVQAGIRLRDFMKQLEAAGLSLPSLGSTNAQSLGGLVASDLHGSAREHGYLSDQILWLKLVDAEGRVHKLSAGPEMYAVAGAIGALGVVIELRLQCVAKYRLEKTITIVDRQLAEDNIKFLLNRNDHLSFYYVGGTSVQSCRMNTWNETINDTSFLYSARHFMQEVFDFVLCGFILGIGRVTQKLEKFGVVGFTIMRIFMNRSLTSNASSAFARQLFYRHDEIEYGIPLDKFVQVMDELLLLLKSNHDYVTIVEIRFCGASNSLLGPGSARDTVFIELAPSLSVDPTRLFTDAEKLFMKFGGKPHLGKWTTATPQYMVEVHGEDKFRQFQELRSRFDPAGKFTNEFVNQVFGPVGVVPPATANPIPSSGGSLFD